MALLPIAVRIEHFERSPEIPLQHLLIFLRKIVTTTFDHQSLAEEEEVAEAERLVAHEQLELVSIGIQADPFEKALELVDGHQAVAVLIQLVEDLL